MEEEIPLFKHQSHSLLPSLYLHLDPPEGKGNPVLIKLESIPVFFCDHKVLQDYSVPMRPDGRQLTESETYTLGNGLFVRFLIVSKTVYVLKALLSVTMSTLSTPKTSSPGS